MEWRVFFIGPMEQRRKPGKGSAKRVDYGSHLPRLHAYLVDHLINVHKYELFEGNRDKSATLKKEGEKIITITPSNLYGSYDIPTNVFDTIDDADLIIADLSGNRPPVIYELAFAHALGIRTIVVGGPQEITFYFSHTRFAEVDFQASEITSADFNGQIDAWINNRNKRFDSPNPLTDFYGAPLPDISAATGLAAGFYDNFARPILTNGNIVFRKEATVEEIRPLKGFIVVRPENLDLRPYQVEENLEATLRSKYSADEVKRGKAGEVFIRVGREGEYETRIPFFLVKDFMIDIPRTMFSLALSPRLNAKTKRDRLLRNNMERVLIERFFEGVKKFLSGDRNVRQEKFHIGSVEEIPSIIETGESKTWL